MRYIAAADQTQPIALAEFNLVRADDYRVPDGGPQRPGPDQLCYSTAALALEVISLGDQTPEKAGSTPPTTSTSNSSSTPTPTPSPGSAAPSSELPSW